jgi:hypothetical protein
MFDHLEPAADTQSPPAETRAERRMRRLEQMSELGLSIGRKLERQAELASAHAEIARLSDRPDATDCRRIDEIARAFAQVCRAVALATAIEDRIDQGLPAIPDLERASRLRDQAARDRRDAAECAIDAAIHADPRVRTSRRLADLKINLHRLLDREVLNLDAFLTQPLPQIIARLRAQLGLGPEEEPELWDENPSPVRGRVMSDGSRSEPCAIANDLAIAAKNAGAQAAGPVAKQREDGVTDAERLHTAPPASVSRTPTAHPHATPTTPRRSLTPSSQPPPAAGAHPSPSRGRIAPHPPP